MTTRKELGRARMKFPGRSITWVDLFLWVLPGVLTPIILVFYGVYLRTFGYAQSPYRPETWFILAAVAIVPFMVILFRRVNSSRKSIIVHTNGIHLNNIHSKHRTLLWCQINAIRTKSTRYQFFGLPIRDKHTVFIEPVHGHEIHVPNHILNLRELSDLIKSKIYPLLLPSIKAELEQGQTIAFGSLMFNDNEVTLKRKSIPWASIKAINIDSGTILLTSDRMKTFKLPVSSVSNFELFLQLVNQKFPAQ